MFDSDTRLDATTINAEKKASKAKETDSTPAPKSVEKTSTLKGVFNPKLDTTYVVNKGIASLFEVLKKSLVDSPQNLRLIGPHGCGKTEMAQQLAARLGMPMLIMDCSNLREARDWFGAKAATDGSTHWVESQFDKVVQAGGHVILLDEINRTSPSVLNTLLPLLDGRRFTYLEEKQDIIRVGNGTIFIATMNEGSGYTGTTSMDMALRDRFPRAVELTYLEEKQETKLLVSRTKIDEANAKKLVKIANAIRAKASGMDGSFSSTLSTRQLIAAAIDFVHGGPNTLEFTITNHFSHDGSSQSERSAVLQMIQGQWDMKETSKRSDDEDEIDEAKSALGGKRKVSSSLDAKKAQLEKMFGKEKSAELLKASGID